MCWLSSHLSSLSISLLCVFVCVSFLRFLSLLRLTYIMLHGLFFVSGFTFYVYHSNRTPFSLVNLFHVQFGFWFLFSNMLNFWLSMLILLLCTYST
jgi:hypothetical protein